MTTATNGHAGAPGSARDASHELGLLRSMLRIRRFEERCIELYSASRIRGFMHLCIGQEAVAVGVMAALGPDDNVVSTYREHGHALARGVDERAVMAEMFGKVEGCSRGRGGSMHLFDVSARFYGGNAIVGGGLPIGVGLALADRQLARPAVTAVLFGDGAMAEGEFHECMNLAALWRLPVLFVCENNRYAMGTALARSHAQTDLAMRAATYGMTAEAVDGMDVLAVEHAARRAVRSVRDGDGPWFLECRTYRFRAHSMYDPERYRERDEVDEWREHDPVPALAGWLRGAGSLDDATWDAMEAQIATEIDDAVAFADAGTLEPESDLTRFVHSERPS